MEHGSPPANQNPDPRRSRSQKRKSFSDASSFKKARPDECPDPTATQPSGFGYGGGGAGSVRGLQWRSCPAAIGQAGTTSLTADLPNVTYLHDRNWFQELSLATLSGEPHVSGFTSSVSQSSTSTQVSGFANPASSPFDEILGGDHHYSESNYTRSTITEDSKPAQALQPFFQCAPSDEQLLSDAVPSSEDAKNRDDIMNFGEYISLSSTDWESWQSVSLTSSCPVSTGAAANHYCGKSAQKASQILPPQSGSLTAAESEPTLAVGARSQPTQPSFSSMGVPESTISMPPVLRQKMSDTASSVVSEVEVEMLGHYQGFSVGVSQSHPFGASGATTPVPVDLADSDGDLPLHLAAATDKEDVVANLIRLMESAQVSLDTRNNLQQTALHVAAVIGHLGIVTRLIRNGASCQLADRNGNTAVHLAVQSAPIDTLRVILDATGSREALRRYNYKGFTPLHLAVFRKDAEIVSVVVEKGANCNCPDGTSGRTPLFHAISTAQENIVRLLIDHGASVNLPNYAGITPLLVATDRRLKNISSLLISKGATINFRDDLG